MLRVERSLALVALMLAASVRAADTAPSAEGVEFFESKIRPIFVDNCFKCHSATAKTLKAELHLDSREGMLKGGESQEPALVPGDVEKSLLIKAVRYQDPDLQMPPKKKLIGEQIAALEAWVKMGAPMPTGVAASAATTRPTRMSLQEGRRFWSFVPPKDHPVPEVKSSWAKNEIDRFILSKLAEKNLAPSPLADKRTLVRRATFDLIGLPPSAKEIDDFEADQSADAFAKVVDRLLASPHYGERWGRYWLDIARYADTKGYVFEEERRYPYAYTYRDWVVRALNEDLPYDQFLIQQIAADKLDLGADKRPLAAMGFLTVGRRFLNAAADIIDDRIDVVTRGTMALTVSCARCHDHKYDPIPTADYYSLYGVFASSREPKDLPVLAGPKKSPETIQFEKELSSANAEIEQFREQRLREITAKLRSAESIAKYLVAAQELLAAGDAQATKIAEAHSVQLWMLTRWRDYLRNTDAKKNAFFAVWNACSAAPVAPMSRQQLADCYAAALVKFDKPDPLTDPGQEAIRLVLRGPDSPVNVTLADADHIFDGDDQLKLHRMKQKPQGLIASHPGSPPRAMCLEDAEPVAPHIFVRGNPATPGAQVSRQFLAILSPDKREPFKQGSGRLELARVIASKDNPLTARVFVNRVWMYHFGNGLVRTPSDFGSRGEKPTHPELLDWLARRFADDDGWSIKKLHRRIMLSAAYQQSSLENPQGRNVDPENQLLWRMNPRRLDFEAMRDALLAASGKLDLTVGGKPVDILAEPFAPRRTLYAFIDRQNLPGMFRTFDFASPDQTSGQRFSTSVPQQALFMINSPFAIEQARLLAGRKDVADQSDPRKRIEQMYRTAIGRKPVSEEIDLGLKFVETEMSQPSDTLATKPATWQYGYGELDEASGQVKGFERFKHFSGAVWQAGSKAPDPKFGYALLGPAGGHPGTDQKHAVIRRWIAPRDCTVSIGGAISHPSKDGDGVRGRIVTPRDGVLATWNVHHREAETKISDVEVRQGESIDFVVDCRAEDTYDTFAWKIVITKQSPEGAVAGDDSGSMWDAATEFAGPEKRPAAPLTPWEKYAQVLLQSNEFIFVD